MAPAVCQELRKPCTTLVLIKKLRSMKCSFLDTAPRTE